MRRKRKKLNEVAKIIAAGGEGMLLLGTGKEKPREPDALLLEELELLPSIIERQNKRRR